RFTIPAGAAGRYLIGGTVAVAQRTDYQLLAAAILVNGATAECATSMTPVASGYGQVLNPSTIYSFAVADFVELLVYQDNTAGAPIDVLSLSNYSPEFYIQYLGA
ncbi:MAG: hypothetical protein ACREA0_24100, partial [bacterium]